MLCAPLINGIDTIRGSVNNPGMEYGFVTYIDESGDDGLGKVFPNHPQGSSEWFVLAAVVVRSSNENAIGRLQKAILSKFKYSQRGDIHYRDLIPAKKIFACTEIAQANIRCFVVMSNKKNIEKYRNQRCAPEKNYLYWWCTRLLLERVSEFCANKSMKLYGKEVPMKLVFSSRGGMSYDRLESYLKLLKRQTESKKVYLPIGNIWWSAINFDEMHVIPHKNEAGLQIADVVAGAFYEAVSVERKNGCDPTYARMLLPRIYVGRHGVYLGNGVKPMPSLARMNLLPSQKAIFEDMGFSPDEW